MNRKEHLLTIAAEECAEVAKECSKSLRFGLDDKLTLDPEGPRGTEGLDNAHKLKQEFLQLTAVMGMLQSEGHVPVYTNKQCMEIQNEKVDRVEAYLKYSLRVGCLTNTVEEGKTSN